MHSTGGLFLGVAFLLPVYLIGGMGAGDVKLMGAVGSILGPQGVFIAFLYSAIAGGLYALFRAGEKQGSQTDGGPLRIDAEGLPGNRAVDLSFRRKQRRNCPRCVTDWPYPSGRSFPS